MLVQRPVHIKAELQEKFRQHLFLYQLLDGFPRQIIVKRLKVWFIAERLPVTDLLLKLFLIKRIIDTEKGHQVAQILCFNLFRTRYRRKSL